MYCTSFSFHDRYGRVIVQIGGFPIGRLSQLIDGFRFGGNGRRLAHQFAEKIRFLQFARFRRFNRRRR